LFYSPLISRRGGELNAHDETYGKGLPSRSSADPIADYPSNLSSRCFQCEDGVAGRGDPLHPTLIESGTPVFDEANSDGLSYLWGDAEHSMVPRTSYNVFYQMYVMFSQIFDLGPQMLGSPSLKLDNRLCVQPQNRHSPEARCEFSYLGPVIVCERRSITGFPCTDLQNSESRVMAFGIIIFELLCPVWLQD
jgi:hypothetical protein